jgi:hypothetical protein
MPAHEPAGHSENSPAHPFNVLLEESKSWNNNSHAKRFLIIFLLSLPSDRDSTGKGEKGISNLSKNCRCWTGSILSL